MKLHLNITGKLVSLLVLLSAVLIGGLGILAYTSGRAGLQEAATSELLTRASEKQAALESWIDMARIMVATKAGDPNLVKQAAALLSAAPGSPEAQAAYNQLAEELQPSIGPETEFTGLFFIGAETGQVLTATDPGEEGKFYENMSFFINGKSNTYVSEMYYSLSLGHPAMTAAAPVMAADGRLLGVLAGQLDLNGLNTLISRRTGLRQTDDAYLVNDIGLLVTQPRFIPNPAVLKKTLQTEAVKRCLDGNSSVIQDDDYRGVPALISYRWLPESRMCLIVKINQAEAYAPSLAFARSIVLTGVLSLLIAIALAIVLARSFTRPILALQAGAKRLGQGDLEYRVAVKSQDEIGLLAAAFNEMAASLEKQFTERKQAQQRIAEALEFNNTLIAASTFGISAYDSSGQCILVNEAIARIIGATREQVLAQNFRQIPSWQASGLLEAAEQTLASGENRYLEAQLTTTFGLDVWVDCHFMRFLSGNEPHLLLVLGDITERKRAEEELITANKELLFQNEEKEKRAAELVVANKELLFQNEEKEKRAAELIVANKELLFQNEEKEKRAAELVVANNELAFQNEEKEKRAAELVVANKETIRRLQNIQALHKIDQAITGSLDLDLTLNVIFEQVKTQLNVDAAAVLLLNPHTQTLEFKSGFGFRGKAFERSRLRLGEGHGGRVALERRMVSVTNLLDNSTQFVRAPLLTDEGFVTYFGTPLIAKGQVNGVLEVFHRSPFAPDENWLELFKILAEQTAIAADSASLFTELKHSNANLFAAYDSTIEGWSHALDLRDKETEGHTQRVTEMMLKLARAAGITEEELVHVRRGALLHDIGKMGVPDHILLKPDKLTDEEWVAMCKHPAFAFELLSPIAYLRPALDIPYCHHEKWDGSGYPRGLKGDQIPLVARLFAIIDAWDALLSDRPYRQGWPKEKVIEHIKSLSGTHFDPKAVELFLKVMNEDTKGAG
jgi:PAS domain S-box-containing protein